MNFKLFLCTLDFIILLLYIVDSYDQNRFSFDYSKTNHGCVTSLPCRCLKTHTTSDVTKNIINCTLKNLNSAPKFTEIAEEKYDEILLGSNNIKTLQNYVFENLNVKKIDLNNNSIKMVTELAFLNIHGVMELQMENNKMTSTPLSLQYLSTLQILNLKNNDIRQLSKKAFDSLTDLKELDLSGNPLHFVTSFDAFQNLSKLRILKLENCSLSHIPLQMMRPMTNLVVFNFRNNNITYIPRASFINSPNIREIDFRENAIDIKNFNALRILRHLKVLKLSDCLLRRLSHSLLKAIPRIHTLLLRHCHIQNVTRHPFRSLFHLSSLDISGNPYVHISDDLFHGLEDRLKFLSIEDMNLPSFPAKQLRKLFVLKKIKASQNDVTYLPENAFRGLKGRYFEIDLMRNRIINISSRFLHGVKTPIKLYLQNNELRSLEFISSLPCSLHGSAFHLSNNPISCFCDDAVIMQYKAFKLTGKCENPSRFKGIKLAPPLGTPPDSTHLEVAARTFCIDVRNRTNERYDCTCNKWVDIASDLKCDGPSCTNFQNRVVLLLMFLFCSYWTSWQYYFTS